MAEIQMYHRDCFVFIDETGCSSKDHTHKFGYAMKGESAVDHRWLHRGTRISAIATMTTTGILAVELMKVQSMETGSLTMCVGVSSQSCYHLMAEIQNPLQ